MDSIVVQPSFQEVIEDSKPNDSFWILRIKPSSDISEEFVVSVNSDGTFSAAPTVDTSSKQQVLFSAIKPYHYVLKTAVSVSGSVPETDSADFGASGASGATSVESYKLYAPLARYSFSVSQITALASNTTHIAYGDSNGSIHVVDKHTKKTTLSIPEAHFSDVTCLKLFPSGKVLISGSLDMTIKIWSMADGSNPRTMVGHSGAITDISLLGNSGRNFLSSSLDGSVRLWETGSASTLYSFKRVVDTGDAVSCVSSYVSAHGSAASVLLERFELDFETAGVYMYVGYASGIIQQYNVEDRTHTGVKYVSKSGVTALAATSEDEGVVYSGHGDGVVRKWSGGKLVAELFVGGAIAAIAHANGGKLVVVSGGILVSVDSRDFSECRYFVGVEGVNAIDLGDAELVAGGKEGLVGYQI